MGYPHKISELLEFDHVIRVNPDLSVTEDITGVHAPECLIDTDDSGQIMTSDETTWLESLKRQGWTPVSGYSAQFGYAGPIMHASEFIGEYMGNEIIDNPGLYVVCAVETLDDSEEAAGWVLLQQEIEIPSEAFTCPCCGTDVAGQQRPICDECTLADCERSTAADGDRGYYDCQRTDTDDYSIQFCDRENNQNITSHPYAGEDATEVRLWSAGSTCIVAVEKNALSGMWHVSASDAFNWTPRARKAHSTWRAAMESLNPAIAALIREAE